MGAAHASLLLQVEPKTRTVRNVLYTTLVCIGVVALILILLIGTLGDFFDEPLFRFLGVVAVLDVLGSIATPLLNRMSDPVTEPG